MGVKVPKQQTPASVISVGGTCYEYKTTGTGSPDAAIGGTFADCETCADGGGSGGASSGGGSSGGPSSSEPSSSQPSSSSSSPDKCKTSYSVIYNCATETWGSVVTNFAFCGQPAATDDQWVFAGKTGDLCSYDYISNDGDDCGSDGECTPSAPPIRPSTPFDCNCGSSSSSSAPQVELWTTCDDGGLTGIALEIGTIETNVIFEYNGSCYAFSSLIDPEDTTDIGTVDSFNTCDECVGNAIFREILNGAKNCTPATFIVSKAWLQANNDPQFVSYFGKCYEFEQYTIDDATGTPTGAYASECECICDGPASPCTFGQGGYRLEWDFCGSKGAAGPNVIVKQFSFNPGPFLRFNDRCYERWTNKCANTSLTCEPTSVGGLDQMSYSTCADCIAALPDPTSSQSGGNSSGGGGSGGPTTSSESSSAIDVTSTSSSGTDCTVYTACDNPEANIIIPEWHTVAAVIRIGGVDCFEADGSIFTDIFDTPVLEEFSDCWTCLGQSSESSQSSSSGIGAPTPVCYKRYEVLYDCDTAEFTEISEFAMACGTPEYPDNWVLTSSPNNLRLYTYDRTYGVDCGVVENSSSSSQSSEDPCANIESSSEDIPALPDPSGDCPSSSSSSN